MAVVVGPINRLEHRMTVPRGQGQKQAVYEIPLLIHAAIKLEDVGGDDFDLALEILQAAFRSANVPVPLTDPVTLAQTALFSIGEEMHLQIHEPGILHGSAGLVHLYAELLISAVEIFQA